MSFGRRFRFDAFSLLPLITNHTCVLAVTTVISRNLLIRTMQKRSLGSTAFYMIPQDRPITLTICRAGRGEGGAREAKMTTCHICIIYVPVVITHCAPGPVLTNLDTAIVTATAHQTNHRVGIRTQYTGIFAVVASMRASPSIMSAFIEF